MSARAQVAALVCAVLAVTVAALPGPTVVVGSPVVAPLPLCAAVYEDGSPVPMLEPDDVGPVFPCLWDAAVLGNRVGTSFVMWHAS